MASTSSAFNSSTSTFAAKAAKRTMKGRTSTSKVAVAVLPALSLALQLTVVVPIGNRLPDAGVQVTGTSPSTVSVAEAVKVTTAPAGLVASTVIAPGTVRVGGSVSP